MKRIFTAILFLCCFKAIAQCPSSAFVHLNEQSDIDNYFANGGCPVVENMLIEGSDISNLNGLKGITDITIGVVVSGTALLDFTGLETLISIGGFISIERNPLIRNFKGLDNLKTIGHFGIVDSDDLENFVGLEKLTTVNGIYIGNCPSLTSLTGFRKFETLPEGLILFFCPALADLSSLSKLKSTSQFSITGCDLIENFHWISSLEVATNVVISVNVNLTSLKGLENLHTAESVQITNNPVLTSIEALGNITSNVTSTIILSNAQLSNCAVYFLCSMVRNPSNSNILTMHNNQGACMGKSQIYSACQQSMPVTLQSFDAALEKQVVNLTWKTSDEQNSEKFEVQHSTNGKDWSLIGEVKSSGTGGLGSDYQFTHQLPASGNNYYRLKMIDLDQSYAQSSIQHVYFKVNLEIIYPNPASDAIRISSLNSDQIASFELINSKGIAVVKRQDGKTDAINLEQYPAGSYTLRILKKDSTIFNHKVVVAK